MAGLFSKHLSPASQALVKSEIRSTGLRPGLYSAAASRLVDRFPSRAESSGRLSNHHPSAYYHEAWIIFDSDGNYMRTPIPLLAVLLLLTTSTPAQVNSVAQYIEQIQALSNRTQIRAANDYIDGNHESILREWIAITEINAP